MEKKQIQLEIVLAYGIDDQNDEEETVVDLIIFEDSTLKAINEVVMRVLSAKDKESQVIYFTSEDSKDPLSMESTVKELGLENGSTIYAETSKRRKRMKRTQADSTTIDEMKDTIMFTCSSRIFQNEGISMRKARVFVNKNHTCANFMEDICTLWNRSGLKFRNGRTLLNADKTFSELGVKHDAEIIVTGGRV